MFIFPRAGAAGMMMARRRPLVDFTGPGATFSRASVATWWDELLLTRYGTNVLRQPESINGFRAFAIEGPRTNLVQLPHTLNGTDWATFVGIAVDPDQQTSPAGDALSADDLDFAADASSRVVYTMPTAPTDDTRYAFSAFGRKVSGDWTGTRPQLRARNKAGAQTTAPAFDDSEDWQRRGASYDVSNGANTADIRAVNAEATARTGAYWGFQYELGAFPTSLIESAGADTTRALDDLEVDVTGNPILTEGFTIHIRPSFSSAEQASHAAFQRILSTQNLHYLRFSSTPGIMQIAGDLGLVGVTGLSYSARQDLTITVDFVAGELTLAGFTTGDGVTEISAAGDWSGGTTMQVGNIGGLSQPYFGLITEPYALR